MSAGFYPDYRLGGVSRIRYCHPEELMRVPEEILESVVFLCTESSDEKVTLRGTGFLLSVPAERVPGVPCDMSREHCLGARYIVLERCVKRSRR